MAVQKAKAEYSSWVKGLITEASPMNFPENASLQEDNFVLRRDGSRIRRLGMDFEADAVVIDSGVILAQDKRVGLNSFLWEQAGGDPFSTLAVVQIGSKLLIFDGTEDSFSSNKIGEIDIASIIPSLPQVTGPFGITSSGGNLVIATGAPEIITLVYAADTKSFAYISRVLTVRDLFGVSDPGFEEGEDIRKRVLSFSAPKRHIYNLRNQTWGFSWVISSGSSEVTADPLYLLRDLQSVSSSVGSALTPANSDNINQAIQDETSGGAIIGKRFLPDLLSTSPVSGSSRAPRGSFIIEALDRGGSRIRAAQERYATEGLTHSPFSYGNLPEDRTPGGATVVREYAGRVWYAGFSGEVANGDSNSPRLSSYLLFSKLVQSSIDTTTCYQDADPTAFDISDLVATDGGFIKLDGAQRILHLETLGQSLVAVADNGVWVVQGNDQAGFTADGYRVDKISNLGGISAASATDAEGSLYFLDDSAIYILSQNETLDWKVQSISQNTIQSFYESIPWEDKMSATASYDSYTRQVKWLFPSNLKGSKNATEIILDLNLQAFSTSTIFSTGASYLPLPVTYIKSPPYRTGTNTDDVTVGGVVVTAAAADVTVTSAILDSAVSEIKYVAITDVDGAVKFSFSRYSDITFRDWPTLFTDSMELGTDAAAYMLTGYITGGAPSSRKQVPRIITHMGSTETGWEIVEGELVPKTPSGCLMSAQWDWANDAKSGKWGAPKQIYRYRRTYFPEDVNDTYVHGYANIVTNNKLRGRGRALSLKFETEPGKDCHLLGWGMPLNLNTTY